MASATPDIRLPTFPATDHYRPLAGTKLYCFVTEARVCEQLAQRRNMKVERPGIEHATCWLYRKSSALTISPQWSTSILPYRQFSCFGWICCAVWQLEEQQQQERQLRDVQTLENEADIAKQKTKLELLKKKLDDLEKEADATTQVRLITRLLRCLGEMAVKPMCVCCFEYILCTKWRYRNFFDLIDW